MNAIATQALVDRRSGKPVVLDLALPRSRPLQGIYQSALPPLKRIKPGSGPQSLRRAHRDSSLPDQPAPPAFQRPAGIVASCDGSFKSVDDVEASGWGFTVSLPGTAPLLDFCGPTVLAESDPCYIGARRHSNNVGELSAMFYALSFIRDHIRTSWSSSSSVSYCIEYDSEYAANIARRLSRARQNIRLALHVRRLVDELGQCLEWRKVESHTGLFLNDRADELAECGASGLFSGLPDVRRWASLAS